MTNLEGRVQKVNRIVPGPGQSRAAWSVLDDLSRRMGGELGATSAEAVMKEAADAAPAYRGITWDLLDWGEGREGVIVPGPDGEQPLEYIPVDAGLISGTGRYALHLGRVMYDDGVITRMSPSLAALAPEPFVYLHPRDAGALAVVEGAMIRATTAYGSATLPIRFDASLAPGTVYVPANLAATSQLGAGPSVELEEVSG